MSPYYKTSLAFARQNNPALAATTSNIITKMTANPVFPTPAVPLTDMQAQLTTFEKSMTDAAKGGNMARAALRGERAVLLTLLKQQASYVQSVAGTSLSDLLSSGFEAAKTTRTRIELPQPAIVKIENLGSTQLALRVTALPTARSYEVRSRTGNGAWQMVGIFTQARRILVPNLVPGTVYEFQVRAVGGTLGYSDWSDPVSHMSL